MKLISLNAWGGKIYQPLMNFIKQHSKNTDIFCFQEIFDTTSSITENFGFRLNLYNELSKILTRHNRYFAPCLVNYIVGSYQANFIDFNLSSGLAIFINKKIKIIAEGDFFVFGSIDSFIPKDLNSIPRNAQYITFESDGRRFTICNLHGIWIKGTKNDRPSRIKQSEQIKNFLDQQEGEKILCGDFNLNPNTKSIKMLEENLRNLIKIYNIKTTRNKLFPGDDKFADYMFVSPGIKVNNFQIPDIEISDHLPMILEIGLK